MWFTDTFYKHIFFRRSCGVCPFCNTRRPSDITIGDFWGWEKTNPTANLDNKGISLLLINTEKGKEVFNKIKSDLDYFPVELSDALQPNLMYPSEIHPLRDQFENEYVCKGFKYIYKKYSRKSPFLFRCIRKLRHIARSLCLNLLNARKVSEV